MNAATEIKNVSDLINALPDAGEFIGNVLGWTIPNEEDNVFSHQKLLELGEKYSVPNKILPKEINIRTAFTKALNKTKKTLADTESLKYIKKPSDNDSRYLVGVVEQSVINETLKFRQVSKIVYNLETQSFDIDNSYTEQIIEGLFKKLESGTGNNDELEENIKLYNRKLKHYQEIMDDLNINLEYHRNHTADDLRVLLSNFAKVYSIRLNPSGGSYFVPRHNNDLLLRIREMLTEINPSNVIYLLSLFSTAESQKTLNTAAVGSLEEEINELRIELTDFIDNAKCSEYLFNKGVNTRVEKIQELQQRVRILSEVLTFQQGEFEDMLDRLLDLTGHSKKSYRQKVRNKNNGDDTTDLIKFANVDESENIEESENLIDDVGF